MSTTLRLAEYDSRWPARFAMEAARIGRAIGPLALAIEHVGSTAVPGLLGKPVLDISIAVQSEPVADLCIAPLTALGYIYRAQWGDDPRRRYYVCDRDATRLAQIHVYILPASGWDDLLSFRDALREDGDLVGAYAAEKRRVAEEVGWDKTAYSKAKGPFIERVLAERRGTRAPSAHTV